MKNVILGLLIFSSISILAQKSKLKNLPNYDSKRLNFGYTIGLNTMDFNIQKSDDFLDNSANNSIYAIENQATLGFHIGFLSNLKLNDFFNLRLLINLSFGQRDLTYWTVKDTTVSDIKLSPHTMKIASTLIEFPLLLKYNALRINNYRPYLIGGFNPKIDLAARKKIKEEEMPKIKLSNFDVYYEFGFGIDFYLVFFRLSTEIKYSVGMLDILIRDHTEYTNTIKKLNSRMIMFSLHFK